MRELEVSRVESDGQWVICVDPETEEHFRIRVDDELRTAVRPDRGEPVPVPSPGDAALRPREIQSRIRAGASVEELAEMAGVSPAKIDRYAHPVLLERARAAELARASHPLTMDGPSLATLGELVAECMVLRGNVPADARWDSWKAEDGHWMIQLSFHDGHIENFAHWRFRPGAHGGTTDPVDELGVELTDPELARAARRTRLTAVPTPVPADSRGEVRPEGHTEFTVDADALIDAQQAQPEAATTPRRPAPMPPPIPRPAPAAESETPGPAPLDDALDLEFPSPSPVPEEPAPAAPPAPPDPAVPPTAHATEPQEQAPSSRPAVPSPRDLADRQRPASSPEHTSASRHRAKRGKKPAVPAWEDVLLGVRAHPDD
ncbi:hypothetical protein GOHSU_21_00260 [Gordonia hirsuta DSM 44140 = NBRC 16056]|uniref:DUF3071 domain-containing protein n=1 Tax=Gordonia hirsuta DSM 44140 = NBRC 16056 TaxID=1121927 RepID=L7L9F5_9ACTN|nr:septation protein SepH [Gordonia hirsuta]GAC57534.1 hypothetical protein GOHSU_21_00260 [Gordonia hirsuta DSM 44140 = NBRC 16056]